MMESPDHIQWLTAVGKVLREARQGRGITLDEVSRVTKISRSQLAAIEEANLQALPAMAYVRGFVRAYGAYLGVARERLVTGGEVPVDASPDPDEYAAPHPPHLHGSRGRRWLLPLMLGLLVLVLAYSYRQQGKSAPERPVMPAVQPPGEPVRKPAYAPVSTAATVQADVVQAPPPGISTKEVQPALQEGGAVLRLKVNQDCWLNITIDGAISQQYDLKAGDIIEWKARETIALDLGNAGGVEAEFNGKPLAPFGGAGKVVHVVLDAEGVSEAQRPSQ